MKKYNSREACSIKNFIVALVLVLCGSVSYAQEANDKPSEATKLIQDLEQASDQVDTKIDVDTARQRYTEISLRLSALGEAALPEIAERLANSSNPNFRGKLTYLLTGIPGESADKALIRLLCFDSSPLVGSTALNQLIQRRERYGPFKFALAEDEINVLLEVVRKADMGRAGLIMRLLGACAMNDIDLQFSPIINRLLAEVKSDRPFPKIKDTYLSPRVYALNQYLLAFRSMGQPAWESLRKAIQKARVAKDAEGEKWLCLCAGYAKDPTVADALKEIVLNDSDRYVRCVAIRAYAASAGKDAIPVLHTLLNDKSVCEYQFGQLNDEPFYIIAVTAEEQIHNIEHPWSPPVVN